MILVSDPRGPGRAIGGLGDRRLVVVGGARREAGRRDDLKLGGGNDRIGRLLFRGLLLGGVLLDVGERADGDPRGQSEAAEQEPLPAKNATHDLLLRRRRGWNTSSQNFVVGWSQIRSAAMM